MVDVQLLGFTLFSETRGWAWAFEPWHEGPQLGMGYASWSPGGRPGCYWFPVSDPQAGPVSCLLFRDHCHLLFLHSHIILSTYKAPSSHPALKVGFIYLNVAPHHDLTSPSFPAAFPPSLPHTPHTGISLTVKETKPSWCILTWKSLLLMAIRKWPYF